MRIAYSIVEAYSDTTSNVTINLCSGDYGHLEVIHKCSDNQGVLIIWVT